MAKKASRSGRRLIVFALLIAAIYGGVALGGDWKPKLGLDLQGGTRITLEASTANGEEITPEKLEEARGITKLKVEHQLSDGAVARKIGRSQSYVSGRLALLALTPEQQDEIRRGDMGVTEATHLGRLMSGNTRQSKKGHVTVAYFGPTNELATKAQARCRRLGHKAKLAGGVGCGACWESVIRADERTHLEQANATASDCVTCGSPLDHTPTGATA